jgi:hypothetical protein
MLDSEYNQLVNVARTATPQEIVTILDRCERTLQLLRGDKLYQRLFKSHAIIRDTVEAQADLFEGRKSVGKMWVAALRSLTSFRDADVIISQLAIFTISQENNHYRIKDDTLRLFITYLHIRVIKSLLEK